MIRRASVADIPHITRLVLAFIHGSIYKHSLGVATPDTMGDLVCSVLDMGEDGVILLAEDGGDPFGILAAAIMVHPVTGAVYCDELIWFVEPTHRGSPRAGIQMLREVERFAVVQGATMIKMVAPIGAKVGGFYLKAGYRPLETVYTKDLPNK